MPFQVYIVTGVLVLAALLFSVYASIKVRSTFSRYSGERPASGMTGYDAARKVLDENGLYGVRIERVSGSMTDHFDPRANVIRLSETVYDVSSTAAVGVAAHEAGHAVQYARHYIPLRLRNAIIPITNIGAAPFHAARPVRPAADPLRLAVHSRRLCRRGLFRTERAVPAAHAPHRIQRQPPGAQSGLRLRRTHAGGDGVHA